MLLFEYQSKTQCPQFFVFNLKKKPFFTLIVYSYTKCIFLKFYLHVNMKKVNGNTARFALYITVST